MVYHWEDGRQNKTELRVSSLTGPATSRTLYSTTDIQFLAPMDWSPDGKAIAVWIFPKDETFQIGLISTQDGSLKILKTAERPRLDRMFFSPDGRWLAYDRGVASRPQNRGISVLAVDGSSDNPVLRPSNESHLMGWSPDGAWLLFSSNLTNVTSLWRVAMADGKPRGMPELIRAGLGGYPSLGVMASGTLYYWTNSHSPQVLEIAALDFDYGRLLSAPTELTNGQYGVAQPLWSPDSKQLAYLAHSGDSGDKIVIRTADGSRVIREFPSVGGNNQLNWAPDGRSFLTPGIDDAKNSGIFRIDAETGDPTLLIRGKPDELSWPACSPDEKTIYFTRTLSDEKTKSLVQRDIASGNERELVRRAMVLIPSLSRDGRNIVFVTIDPATNARLLLMASTAGGQIREMMRTPGAAAPDGLNFVALSKGETFLGSYWSADSQSFLTRKRIEGQPNDEVWRISLNGDAPRRVELQFDHYVPLVLSVRPDGRGIAFCANHGAGADSEFGPSRISCPPESKTARESPLTNSWRQIMIRCSAGFGLALLLTGLLPAQTPDQKTGTFELADVHVSAPGTQRLGGFTPGRVEQRGRTMLELIQLGWGVEAFQIFGDLPWMNSDKYDIVAKAPDATARFPEMRPMLQSLLADRFKLVVHEEQRDLPVFLLTVAKGGAKLKAAADPDAPAKEVPATGGDPSLNVRRSLRSFKMADLARSLPGLAPAYANHPVIDETGLKGSYDIDMAYMGRAVYNTAKANPDGPPAVGLYEALDKLGLKLEAAKRPQPALVIDSANETPTPNAEGVTAKLPTVPTEFELAELRPAKPGAAEAAIAARNSKAAPVPLGPNGYTNIQNGQVEILGATLRGLVSRAYGVDDRWIVNAPAWMSKDRFDILAKSAPGVPIRDMLKKLIDERFALATHKEDQPMQVYVLSAGKQPKLKPSDGKSRSECSIVFTDQRNYVCTNTTIAQFAERLPGVAGSYIQPPIVDATGLAGAFDFQFYYTPKAALQSNGGAGSSAQASTPVNELTLYEAVDKQLGLKLEEKKRPVPVLVIDRANQLPSEK